MKQYLKNLCIFAGAISLASLMVILFLCKPIGGFFLTLIISILGLTVLHD